MPIPSDFDTGLTADDLREIVDYDPDTQIFRWRSSWKGPYQRAGEVAGSKDDRPYPVLTIKGRTYYQHRLAWLYTRGVWPAAEIDHAHGNKKNHGELREATRQQNARNQGPTSRNKTGYRGVTPTRNGKRFSAFHGLDGKCVYLGTFDIDEEAARAYDAAASKIYGEFARLNFPQGRTHA